MISLLIGRVIISFGLNSLLRDCNKRVSFHYWLRLFGRLLMVPIVSGISFEIIQWAGRSDSKLADFFSKPGLAMQKLTTKEPTADMAEVAIKAVEAVFDWRAYLKEEFGVEAEQ